MSDPRFTLFAARAVFDDRLSPTDVRVLAALGTYSNKQGWCNPKQGTLAERLGVSRTTVTAAIKNLISAGYLEAHAQVLSGRGRTANKYRVMLDLEPMSAQTTPGADVSTDDKTAVVQADIGGADVVPAGHPLSSQLDIPEKNKPNRTIPPPPIAHARDGSDAALWASRLREAQTLADVGRSLR